MTGNERHTGKDRIRTKAETKPNACGAAASVEPPVTPAPPEQLTLVGEPEKDNAGKGKAKGRKRRGTAAISLDDFFAWLPSKQQVPAIKQLLSEFMESRQALRRPVTENAARQIIRDFAIYDDVVLGVALQRSIRAGWQGLFVPQNMANFKNEFAADINAYHRLADECRANEDPEERRRRLLQRKEAEVREMHEGFIRKEYRELDADIARQAAEVPTWRPVMTKSHGIIGADFFRDGEWHRVFNRGCDASMLDGGDAGSHDAPAGSATSQDCATGQDCAADGTTAALAGTPAPQQEKKTDTGPTARLAEDAREKNSFNSAVEEMYARMRAQGIDVDGILAEEAAKSREPEVFDAPMPLPLDEAIAAMEREAQATASAH